MNTPRPEHPRTLRATPAQAKPLLVLAAGNPSRGDDAFGPLLAERLSAWLSEGGQAWQTHVDVVNEQQLAVEHLLDMQARRAVLFVDASVATPGAACALAPHIVAVNAATEARVNSHSCSPAQLLWLFQDLLLQTPPPAFVLTASGQDFELGAPLSGQMRSALDAAWPLLHGWLAEQLGGQEYHRSPSAH